MKKILALFLALSAFGCEVSTRSVPQPKSDFPPTPVPAGSAPRNSGNEKSLSGRVVRVADGDTLTIRDSDGRDRKVRLFAIDAPELHQDFGQNSRRNLDDLAYKKDVVVYFKDYDQYGRVIGRVMKGDVDLNLEQIRAGCAWHFKRYEGDQPADARKAYEDAERAAKSANVGLWASPNPEPPWDWRKENPR